MNGTERALITEVSLALSSEVRVGILDTISNSLATVGEIAERLGIRPSVCSHHLNILKKVGLVRCSKSGQFSVYSRITTRVEMLVKVLSIYLEGGEYEIRRPEIPAADDSSGR